VPGPRQPGGRGTNRSVGERGHKALRAASGEPSGRGPRLRMGRNRPVLPTPPPLFPLTPLGARMLAIDLVVRRKSAPVSATLSSCPLLTSPRANPALSMSKPVALCVPTCMRGCVLAQQILFPQSAPTHVIASSKVDYFSPKSAPFWGRH